MYWNKDVELFSRKEIEEIQSKRLSDMAKYCYDNVPFYNNSFKRSGLKPNDIKSLDDIVKIPLTLKDNLRENYPFKMFAKPLEEIVRLHASSGTSGSPTVVGYTRNDIETWTELMARTITCPGGHKGDILQNAYGYGLFTGGLGFHYGAERIGAAVIPISGGNTGLQLKLMKDFGSTILTCTPSYSLFVAEFAKQEGINIEKEIKLRMGIFGAEPASETLRSKIEESLNIDAYDIYGLSEIYGPGVSVECPEKNGLHIWEDQFIPEIIDKETKEPVSPGEKGVLLFTPLTKEGIPLLRYVTNDITSLNYYKCGCGREMVRMSKVMGRADDMLIVRGVNVYPSQIEHVLMGIPGVSENYQIVVDRDILDTLTVKIEVTPERFSDKIRDLVEFQRMVEDELFETLRVKAKIELVAPGEIPRSMGKAKRVIDLRKENI
ncbi:MAG: phenylacetate--CoA ligase family protein [Candidatus Jordarchaeum sp.]|uniref:phenylacetate--CoA ligase family protein n=1 Tax=Candidatus Jordarchaeum sp. TaxID=2823881 RepID=UPI0040494349